jgi:hypothetical protein
LNCSSLDACWPEPAALSLRPQNAAAGWGAGKEDDTIAADSSAAMQDWGSRAASVRGRCCCCWARGAGRASWRPLKLGPSPQSPAHQRRATHVLSEDSSSPRLTQRRATHPDQNDFRRRNRSCMAVSFGTQAHRSAPRPERLPRCSCPAPASRFAGRTMGPPSSENA